jgi:nucleotide-binding universal stress UspA family protein
MAFCSVKTTRWSISVIATEDNAAWARHVDGMARKLLLAIDGQRAIEPIAQAVAQLFGGANVEAVVLHVRERQSRGVALQSKPDAERLVERTVSALRRSGIRARGRVQSCLLNCVHLAILDVADQEGVETIVLGTYRRSRLARWLQGSVSRSVIRTATIPVFTVPLARWRPDDREAAGHSSDAPNVVALKFKARLHRPHQPVA